MLTTEASVSLSWVNTVLSAAQRQGLSVEPMLAHAGLSPSQLNEARWPIDDITRLWRAAADLTSDPGFGLHAGQLVGPASFNVVSFILQSSSTLREAIMVTQKFQRLISDGGRFQLLEGPLQSWLIYHPQQGELAFSPHQLEAVLAAVISFSRWVLGQPVKPVRAQFSHARLGPLALYQEVFQAEVDFNQAFCGLQFDNAVLDLALPQADAQLATLHREYAAARLAALSHAPDFLGQLRHWLGAHLAQGVPERQAAAQHLKLSERVLARRLQALGLSYSQLVDQVRKDKACQAVADTDDAFASIAQTLGFSEASAFNRAFKRWTGHKPGDWRQRRGRE
ncbi:AraC family transcriptional regulator [Rhodoferax sp.]|uniref:AraC family transcriptional regulator n=1 Tax=Rhodoferax sp. TaxID=50421 RepID=UPI00261F27AD|nr:AraC family transcriptional regulator [Rhodoferax sp.]MDD2927119.1 AraC family transcriptional regulator [Rhodoferax sp.]